MDFHKYFDGTISAPVLTIFIGGNHEATNVLRDLYYGGWVAPNIFYLGHSGVITYKGVRIGGVSGIFNKSDYYRGYFEFEPPYESNPPRSAYHYRAFELLKLAQLAPPESTHIDLFLSHDWPAGIEQFGNAADLIRRKPFFEQEIRDCVLGSEPLWTLLTYLKPKMWSSAHLHCKFTAEINWQIDSNCRTYPFDPSTTQNSIVNIHTKMETNSEDGINMNKFTKFLALDKVGFNKAFMEVITIDDNDGINDNEVRMDPEWMAIQAANAHLFPRRRQEAETLVGYPSQEVIEKAKDKNGFVYQRISDASSQAYTNLRSQTIEIEAALAELIGHSAVDVGFEKRKPLKNGQSGIQIRFLKENKPIHPQDTSNSNFDIHPLDAIQEIKKKETTEKSVISSVSNEEAARQLAAQFLIDE